jgi:biotin synthase
MKYSLIERLKENGKLEREEWVMLLSSYEDEKLRDFAAKQAREVAQSVFGKKIYVRGLIEFTNYCKNNCYYCGIRRDNKSADRYRLDREDILECCREGWALGFRTFVLQGGEDGFYDDSWYEETIRAIKKQHPECAITLSIGERSEESYRRLFHAGADRYLLRHETADNEHYRKLHPSELSPEHRKDCLYQLKEIGYQVGCGFMVGSPEQTMEQLAADMEFIHELRPHMVGIGPFIPAANTPFEGESRGSLELTLFLLSLLRLQEKEVLLPATTALGTIHPQGRELGILAGANVVMPNLSPVSVRKKYSLYDNKICTGEEAAECRGCLERRVESIGYHIVSDRGDSPYLRI